MSFEGKRLTRDSLSGMQVIDSGGNLIGIVKDIAFTVGKLGISLYVETKSGESKAISWEDVQAAADFILLKPQSADVQPATAQPSQQPPAAAVEEHICPVCKGPLTYIPQYQRWYCYKDQRYV